MFYIFARIVVTTLLKLFWFFKVERENHIPKNGPLLIVSNHVSYFDPPVVGCAIPRKVRFFAKDELFSVPILSFLIRHLEAVPLKSDVQSVGALRLAMKLLKDGNVICIFPEGTRSYDGKVKEFLNGASYIALKLNVPILVVGIKGTFDVLPRGARFPKLWRRISVRMRCFSSPEELLKSLNIGYNKNNKLDKLSEAMRGEVIRLIRAQERGS